MVATFRKLGGVPYPGVLQEYHITPHSQSQLIHVSHSLILCLTHILHVSLSHTEYVYVSFSLTDTYVLDGVYETHRTE